MAEDILEDPDIAKHPSTLQSLFTAVKKALCKATPPIVPTATQMSDEGIDRNAFYFHTPNCIPIKNRGLHRSVGQEDNPNYDICAAAMKAKNEAVNRCVKLTWVQVMMLK